MTTLTVRSGDQPLKAELTIQVPEGTDLSSPEYLEQVRQLCADLTLGATLRVQRDVDTRLNPVTSAQPG